MKLIQDRARRSSRTKRVLAGGAAVATALGFVAVGAMPVQDEADVDATRDTLEEWVETRRVLSKEKADWALGRELLEDRIELVRGEIESLRERIADAQSSIAEADEKRVELIEENQRYKDASVTLEEMVAVLEGRTRALLTRLPEPIVERVKPLSQRLPKEGAEVKQSLGERFQNIVGILNEVNKFNGEITVTSEVRDLSDGTSAEVAAIYLGIGQSFYAASTGTAAGIGRPGPDGWTWSESNDDAEAVRLAIAVMKNEAPAEFVLLPVRVAQDEAAPEANEAANETTTEQDDREVEGDAR